MGARPAVVGRRPAMRGSQTMVRQPRLGLGGLLRGMGGAEAGERLLDEGVGVGAIAAGGPELAAEAELVPGDVEGIVVGGIQEGERALVGGDGVEVAALL